MSAARETVRCVAAACALAVAASPAGCKEAPQSTAAARTPAPSGPAAAGPAAGSPGTETSPRVVEVRADGHGFTPSRIEARPREALALRFTRTVEKTCADVVVVQGDPVRHVLPVGHAVEVRVAAPEDGALKFACGMDMYKGAVVVSR